MSQDRSSSTRPCPSRQRAAAVPALLMLAAMAGCQAMPPPTPCDMAVQLNAATGAESGLIPPGPASLASIGRRGARVLDEAASAALLIEDVQVGRRPNGSSEVAVRITNCTAVPLQLEGATQFFAPSGGQAEPPSVWKRLFIPPRTSRTYEELSTGTRATGFLIELRGGR